MKFANVLATTLRLIVPKKFAVNGPNESLDKDGNPTGIYSVMVSIGFYSQTMTTKWEMESLEGQSAAAMANVGEAKVKQMCMELIHHMREAADELERAIG